MNAIYSEESHLKQCGQHMFTVNNMTPVYSESEKAKAKRDIENTLYKVFSKYNKNA